MKVIHLSTPEKAGLYINTVNDPTGVYELWIDRGNGVLYRSGWIKCSEEPSKEFLQRWLLKCGVTNDEI